jgi:hypothetical protein
MPKYKLVDLSGVWCWIRIFDGSYIVDIQHEQDFLDQCHQRVIASRYVTDAGDWLTQIEQLLFDADTPAKAAAGDFIRVARESVRAARKQLVIDSTINV